VKEKGVSPAVVIVIVIVVAAVIGVGGYLLLKEPEAAETYALFYDYEVGEYCNY